MTPETLSQRIQQHLESGGGITVIPGFERVEPFPKHRDPKRAKSSSVDAARKYLEQAGKARQEHQLAKRIAEMAADRYSQRYTADILGITRKKVELICQKYDITFNASPGRKKE